jgi:hypothetical protein
VTKISEPGLVADPNFCGFGNAHALVKASDRISRHASGAAVKTKKGASVRSQSNCEKRKTAPSLLSTRLFLHLASTLYIHVAGLVILFSRNMFFKPMRADLSPVLINLRGIPAYQRTPSALPRFIA